MHDPKFLRLNREKVEAGVAKKHVEVDLSGYYRLDARRLELLREAEELKARRNKASEDIARRKKAGEDAAADIAATRELGERIKAVDAELREVGGQVEAQAAWIPNLPHPSVPEGRDTRDNVHVRAWGEPRAFDFEPRPHWELATALGLLDFARASKIAGSGFLLFTGRGARLERALIQFMLEMHTGRHGYTEVWPPHVVRREVLFGTGQLPKLEADMYHVEQDDLFLNPTAEVPVTNIYRDEILEPGMIPRRHTAYCASYRYEAGAYGRETRGMVRVHQFDKVELVRFALPERSYDEHEELARDVSDVFEALQLPYRVLLLCAGELSFAASKCYDFEVWAPGSKAWLECSSCSNFEDFQARRIDLRFRREAGGKVEHPHTLNASGVALPRTYAALLENHQTARGAVRIPKALRPYLDGMEEIGPE